MSWRQGLIRGFVIFLYLALATVWLPDVVLQLDVVAEASVGIRDLVGLLVWGGAFVAGLWMLRRGQRRGLI